MGNQVSKLAVIVLSVHDVSCYGVFAMSEVKQREVGIEKVMGKSQKRAGGFLRGGYKKGKEHEGAFIQMDAGGPTNQASSAAPRGVYHVASTSAPEYSTGTYVAFTPEQIKTNSDLGNSYGVLQSECSELCNIVILSKSDKGASTLQELYPDRRPRSMLIPYFPSWETEYWNVSSGEIETEFHAPKDQTQKIIQFAKESHAGNPGLIAGLLSAEDRTDFKEGKGARTLVLTGKSNDGGTVHFSGWTTDGSVFYRFPKAFDVNMNEIEA